MTALLRKEIEFLSSFECPATEDLYTKVFSLGRENFLISFIHSTGQNLSACILGTLHLMYTETQINMVNVLDLLRCKKEKSSFIILLILLHFPDESLHSLCLMIDNRRKEVESFDPDGIQGFWWPLTDEYLENLSRKYFPGYEYVSTLALCPIGPQFISQDEFCTLWTLFYIYLRLKYPVINSKVIVGFLSENTTLVISFLCYLDLYAETSGMYRAIEIIRFIVDQENISDETLDLYNELETYRLKADYDSIIEAVHSSR